MLNKTKKEITEMILKAQDSFKYFVFNIFSLSFTSFKKGQYVEELADWMQMNDWFMRISAKDHFKSTSLYADFMWQLLKNPFKNQEFHYFSYQDSMAAYHIGKIKKLIYLNPLYESCIDLKPTAEGVISYSWDYSYKKKQAHVITMEPHGLLTFKRGIHCDGVYVDDPLQDPDNKLLLTKIVKINNIIKTQILDMPKADGFCKVVGTPQTTDDFFFDKNLQKKFAVKIQPAEKDPKNKVSIWPEHMTWDELKQRELIRGKKIYNQEYLCSPVYSENSWFTKEEILKVVNPDLSNRSIFDIINTAEHYETFAGWDLGKKRHPAHFTVFQIKEINGQRKAIQIHQAFFDSWDYAGRNDDIFDADNPTQLSYIKQAIKAFRINRLFADNTRGELTTLEERKELPREIELCNFTSKDKYAMATDFEKGVNQGFIELQNDQRMISQILLVTNDLQAVETPEGHGDSFWSIALCFKGIRISITRLSDFIDDEDISQESDIYQKSF